MPGMFHSPRKFAGAETQPLGVNCSQCGDQDTVLVCFGDVEDMKQFTYEHGDYQIIVSSGIVFASCNACGFSWELEKT